MAEGQGVAGCSGETAESSSVLLVSGQYATSEDCSSPVSRQVAQTLTGAGRKVYSTVLEDTEEDRKCAEADGVELILPTRSQGDTREPCLDWLTFDHVDRYPNDRLPQDVGWIVGHAGVTSRAAATIKEQRFPQASLSLVTQTIPEDTEKYKEEEKAMGIGEKEDSIRQDAEKAVTVFSVGHRAHDHFTISFCAIPEDKKPAHYLFLPKPSDLFLNTTVKHVKTSQKVVLLIGRVTTDERVKGFDLAAKILSKVVERSQDRIKLRICGVSKEEYQASKSILQTSINSGKLIPTLLPHGTQEDVCRHMKQAHLVLMPSRAEPFGLVGLEAMAAGVPVLISDQSGLADLVNKVVPEFHHSVLRITGDDSVDVRRWADQIADVLRMSEAEFRRAAELKQKLLESKYWEESHQQFLQAFGAGHVAEVQKGKSGATLTGETATDGGSRNPSEPGSPRASSSQLKRKGEDGEEFPGKKKPASCREEELREPQPSTSRLEQEEQTPAEKLLKPRTKSENGHEEADVQEYFDKVINGVSYKWDDLARKLGFGRNEIKGIRTTEPSPDHRCREVLHRWRNREGREATLQVLKQALIDINERATAESLEGSPRASSSQLKRKGEDGEEFPGKKKPATCREEDLFQTSVKTYYELKLTHFKPLIWNDNFTLSLTDIFTQLELIQKSKHKRSESMRGEQRKELKSLDDLFKPDVTGLSTAPRCILIEGEAGGGKTTFLSKEALDAISQKTELGRRHDIVLLIRLREVREGETIEEMVWDQCVPETTEGVDVQSIRTILQRNESHVLFLLDGYDELRPEARAAGQAIPKLLSGKMYPNSTILISSRPSARVQQHTRPDCHVQIVGFSPIHIMKYVEEYFVMTGNPELGQKFVSEYFPVIPFLGELDKLLSWPGLPPIELPQNQSLLRNLIQTPIFLMLLCLLWEEDQKMVSTGTMTGLYDNLLTCLVRKHCEREGVDMPTEGLPTEVAESLLQLGKLALEALLRNETLLDLAEVDRENVDWKLPLKLGVVSQEVSSSKLHPRKQLNFSHKTMQEFLAGRYVAHVLVHQDIVDPLQLTSISKVFEFNNVLQFTWECNSQAAQAVMEELNRVSSIEFAHLQPEQFENVNVTMDRNKRKTCQTYDRFAHLCLNILSERQEPEVLQVISEALPVVIMAKSIDSREATALKYYIQNLRSANLPDRLILKIGKGTDTRNTVQYLHQCFTTSLPGLKVDLKLAGQFDSPDETARLASVLTNIPCLRALHLSDTKLTPSSLRQLVQGFRLISLLEELNLHMNFDLGDAGMEVLQDGLSRLLCLAVLHLGTIKMTSFGMSSLTSSMRRLVGLRELHVGNNFISDIGLESLSTILPIFSAMQVLDLARIGITPTTMHILVPALCKLTRLIKLDISINTIGDLGLECLAAILHHLTAMKVLGLSNTGISDRGISALNKALPHLVQLQALNVNYNNIGDSGIVSLVQTLCQPRRLDMEQNPPGDKTTAPHCNNTLQELHMGENKGVTGAGLERVSELISALPALTILDMSGPQHTCGLLSDTAAMNLAKTIPRLPSLEKLDLWFLAMEPAGFQAVMQAAEEHPTLEKLGYDRCGVPEGANPTASCLVLYNRWVPDTEWSDLRRLQSEMEAKLGASRSTHEGSDQSAEASAPAPTNEDNTPDTDVLE